MEIIRAVAEPKGPKVEHVMASDATVNDTVAASDVEWAIWQAEWVLDETQDGPCTIGPVALTILVREARRGIGRD